MLQEAVVQATVEGAGVGDDQTPILVHKDRDPFSVDFRGLQASKGGVPTLDSTCTQEPENNSEQKSTLESVRKYVA